MTTLNKWAEFMAAGQTRIDVIKHNGVEYKVDLDGKEKPIVEYQRTYTTANDVWDVYRLTGAHEGPPIEVELRNARMDRDDDGWNLEIEVWRWADDKTRFDDDVLCDIYCDAVRDHMSRGWDR